MRRGERPLQKGGRGEEGQEGNDGRGQGGQGLLADEQDIDGAQVEVIKEGEGGQAVVGWVLAGVELGHGLSADTAARGPKGAGPEAAYHDCLPLVLDDVARPADLVPAAEAEKHELVGRVDGLFRHGRGHGRSLPLGSHALFCCPEIPVIGSRRRRDWSACGAGASGGPERERPASSMASAGDVLRRKPQATGENKRERAARREQISRRAGSEQIVRGSAAIQRLHSKSQNRWLARDRTNATRQLPLAQHNPWELHVCRLRPPTAAQRRSPAPTSSGKAPATHD